MNDEKAVHCRVAVLVSFSVVEGLQKKNRYRKKRARRMPTAEFHQMCMLLRSSSTLLAPHQKENRKANTPQIHICGRYGSVSV